MRRLETGGLAALIAQRGARGRTLTALAGPPGAGKSFLAAALAQKLNTADPGSAAVVPMDGFHLDDTVLEARGLRARKGAPETFDTGGLAAVLARLSANTDAEIAIPLFDRRLEIARAGAAVIPQAVRHIIIEGNYLLLARAPWREMHGFFTTTVMVKVADDLLRRRLTARWDGAGLDAAAVRAKVDDNDLVNARCVMEESVEVEIWVGA